MGLMLEQVNPNLMKTVHRFKSSFILHLRDANKYWFISKRFAPSKKPDLRIQQLRMSGIY